MTKNDTKMIQGLSVIAMVCLHLFNRWDYQNLYSPLLFFNGIPLAFYFSQLSDFCVMGFAFCSGYGHYKTHSLDNYYKKSLKRLLLLYINFWIILVSFSIVSICVGKGAFMPANAFKFITTFFTISPSYNGAWWYLPVYAVIVIISPLILKLSKKINSLIVLAFTLIIYCASYLLRFRYKTGIEAIDWFGPFGMTFAEYLIGVLFCKENIFEKLTKLSKKINKYILHVIFLVVFLSMLYVRTSVIPSLSFAPISGIVIIIIFQLMYKPEFFKKFFQFIGTHSTNIWLTHMFFYFCLFVNFVYKAKYPILIIIFMLAICIAISFVINLIMNPIRKKVLSLQKNK